MSGRIKIEDVQRIVCDRYGVDPRDMRSSMRARRLFHPRMIAIYLVRSLTPLSLTQIGKRFGHRDHTTILHSCRRAQEFASADPEFAGDLVALAWGVQMAEPREMLSTDWLVRTESARPPFTRGEAAVSDHSPASLTAAPSTPHSMKPHAMAGSECVQ